MDSNTLVTHLNNTLSTDNVIRKNSERLLLELDFGVVSQILSVLINDSGKVSLQLQLVGLTLIKNRISTNLNKSSVNSDMKDMIKNQIIEFLVKIDDPFLGHNSILIKMCLKIIELILLHDEGDFQIQLLKFSNKLMTEDDSIKHFYIGVLLVCQVSRRNRNLNSFELIDSISQLFLPIYLSYLRSLCSELKESAPSSADSNKLLISYKILKTLNYISTTRVNKYFQDLNSHSLLEFCKVLSDLFYLTLLKTYDIRNSKWILRFFIKLHLRSNQMDQNQKGNTLTEYSEEFKNVLTNDILKFNCESIIDSVSRSHELVNKLISLADDTDKSRTLYYFLIYLGKLLIPSTYPNIENNLEFIISNIIVPTLSINKDEIESFEFDPVEFINSNLSSNMIFSNSATSFGSLYDISNSEINLVSSSFIIKLVKLNPDICNPLISLIGQILSSEDNDINYSCALNLLKVVQRNIDEEILISAVKRIIEINSKLNTEDRLWLRCLIYQFFSDLNLRSINLDPFNLNLPISLEASQPLPLFVITLKLIILKSNADHIDPIQLMQILLSLNESENLEIIRDLIDLLVEKYPQELSPYGNQLIQSLCSLFLRTIEEEKNGQSAGEEGSDDKLIGFINNMITIIMSVNDKKSIIEMNEHLSLVVNIVLDNGVLDLLESVMELVEEISTSSKTILNLEIVVNSFKNFGFDFFDYYESYFKLVYSIGTLDQRSLLNELISWVLVENGDSLSEDPEFVEFISILTSEMVVSSDVSEHDNGISDKVFNSVMELMYNSYEDKEEFWDNKTTYKCIIGGLLKKTNIIISMFGDKLDFILHRFKQLIDEKVWCTVYDLKLGMLGLLELIKNGNSNAEIKNLSMNLISTMCDNFSDALAHRSKLLKFTVNENSGNFGGNDESDEEDLDIELDEEFDELNKISVIDHIDVIEELKKYL